ncbi:hypothetical protein SISSUDRAFT_983506 [Sistotremastrum suecicum HHB10207 ss-3]|uniref:Integrase core domain-containing protein n=1 Tax=Sistotremastrum suecicum HHB10207 ss-3 TaxID=1314776 RepID=A0A166F550_9AGAM|nr:hypothetical protein SISSUDRAFT_983506 [Sistotremastrum suecicum HHB10207 ss-3]
MRHPHKGPPVKHTGTVIVLGPHHKWCVDGHEKLAPMGYPIYGIRDAWGKILGYWVVPNARNEVIIEYLYLLTRSLIITHILLFIGVPITVTSDKGTETGNLYALQTLIREEADPSLDSDVVPAHLFLRSVKNIVIERSWKDWLREGGRNLGLFFTRNSGVAGFVPENPIHRCLADWIWVPLIQQELDKFVSRYNSRKIRRQPEKHGPSGASHNRTFNFPELFDGKSQLIEVDRKVIDILLADHEGRELVRFVPEWFENMADEAHNHLGSPDITLENAWAIFPEMLRLIRELLKHNEEQNALYELG